MVHKHTSRDVAVRIIATVKLLVHVAQLLDHFTSCIRHTPVLPVGLDSEVREEVVECLGEVLVLLVLALTPVSRRSPHSTRTYPFIGCEILLSTYLITTLPQVGPFWYPLPMAAKTQCRTLPELAPASSQRGEGQP